MKAVVMAGGEGTRLRPLTSNQPKPMIPLANIPMMEHVIRLLAQHGFEDIVVTVAFLANAVRTYFGDGSEFGVRISYATEESPLGTAGSVRNARDELGERFLVISGDVVTDIDLSAVVAEHEAKGALATIALKAMDNPLEFGIVITRADGSIDRFLEKPTWGQVFSDTINTGIYVLEPEIFDYIAADRPVDFSGEVFPALLEAGASLFGSVVEGYWEDVGTLEAYQRAHQDVLDRKVDLELPGFQVRPGVWIGEGAEIDSTAVIEGPVIVGDYCRVGANARLSPYSVLGANVRVGADATIERSVIHDNGYIGERVEIRGSVVGRSADLRRNVHLHEGVVLGDACRVGADAVLTAGVKVYPSKVVEAGAVVNSSLVWESRATRNLFGRRGVSGLANVDISPELAVRLSMAYAAGLPRGSRLVTSRDTSRAARVLKRACMVGVNASGVDVDDLEAAPVPLTRFAIRSGQAQGGITVRLAPEDPQSVIIRFLDANGLDLDEVNQRKVERLLGREDFRRALAGEIGDIEFPGRTVEQYTETLIKSIDVAAIRAARFKMVLDYAFGITSFVMPNVLAKLGADVLVVNPYGATLRAVGFDRDTHAKRVAELVQGSGAHLGVVIDPGGELVTLVHDGGQVMSDDEAALAMLRLVLMTSEQARIALPVSAPLSAEALCRESGAELVWAKMSPAGLMDVAARGEVDFAAGADGGFVFPDFLPAYDAAASLMRLLGMLATTGLRLSKVAELSPAVHIAHRSVPTAWEAKGLVMRSLVESNENDDLLLVDGVKFRFDDGWALVLPDPDEPVTNIWAEAATDRAAAARAQEWAGRVAGLLGR